MGIYFNPSNESFTKDRNNKIYIDKTGLLEYLNESIGTPQNCIALSHARRFGKSHAAGMIDAYYSLGCDSTRLFENTTIAKSRDYKKYMNKYNVIHLDISSFWDFYKDNIIEKIVEYIYKDFKDIFGDELEYQDKISYVLMSVYQKTAIPFVIIIDEWDCVIRNSENKELVHRYLQFLHALLKSEESKSFLALAYITGILPIKKIHDESALNNFREYTMLDSYPITEYYGFTEEEVRELCKEYNMDFDSTKAWYNGYLIDGEHMYNPNSVSMAMERHKFDTYWKNTSSFASINTFITMNYAGLKDDVMTMLAGGKVMVETEAFQNDLFEIHSKDDALTALIHLGYLGYDADRKSAYIPNYEVAKAFEQNEYDAVVFDMDGVIFDSERATMDCWIELADKYGIKNMEEIYAKEASQMYHSKYDGGKLPMKKGILELLSFLKAEGKKIALASSTRRQTVVNQLKDAGILDFFDAVICGDMVERSKPAPDIFLKACEEIKVLPEKSYGIEDSYNGIRAVHAGKLHPIMVPDLLPGNEEMEELAEVILGNLLDVKEYLIGKTSAKV